MIITFKSATLVDSGDLEWLDSALEVTAKRLSDIEIASKEFVTLSTASFNALPWYKKFCSSADTLPDQYYTLLNRVKSVSTRTRKFVNSATCNSDEITFKFGTWLYGEDELFLDVITHPRVADDLFVEYLKKMQKLVDTSIEQVKDKELKRNL